MSKKIYAVCLALCLQTCVIYAQKKSKELQGAEVDSVVSYKPRLQDAVKISVIPEKEKNDARRPDMKYATPSFQFSELAPYNTVLKPAGIKQNFVLESLERGYAKIGFGNYLHLTSDVYISSLRSKDLYYTLHGKYNYMQTPSAKKESFHDAGVDASLRKIIGKNSFGGAVAYNGNIFNYYGTAPTDAMIGSKNFQNFSDLMVNVNMTHALRDTGKLKVETGITYRNFQDFYHTTEHNISATGVVTEPLKTGDVIFEAAYDYLYYSYFPKQIYTDIEEKKYNRNITLINVKYKTDLDFVRGSAGFKTATESDTASSIFHFYPDVHADFDIVGKYVTAYAVITGGLQKNTFRSIAVENPFIQSNIFTKNTNNALETELGIKGSSASGFSYAAYGKYNRIKNMYYYANDSVESRRFSLIYDPAVTQVIKIHAEGLYAPSKQYTVMLSANYYQYILDGKTVALPYYKPTFDVIATGTYRFNKFLMGADVFAFGKRSAYSMSTKKTDTLKGSVDANLWADYNFNDRIVFYLQLKNIFGSKYNFWSYYPVYGFQAMGGIRIRFW